MDRVFKFVRREPSGFPVVTLDGQEIRPPWTRGYKYGGRSYYNADASGNMRSFNFYWLCCSAIQDVSHIKSGTEALGYFNEQAEIEQGYEILESELVARLAELKLLGHL